MGILALRDKLDISGVTVDADLSLMETRIELIFHMPAGLSTKDRLKLEGAAAACPIKSSFHPDVRVSVQYDYQDATTEAMSADVEHAV